MSDLLSNPYVISYLFVTGLALGTCIRVEMKDRSEIPLHVVIPLILMVSFCWWVTLPITLTAFLEK